MIMRKPSTPPLLLIGHGGDLSDIRYGCGFTPVDPVVFLDGGLEQHLVVPLLEVGRAGNEAPRTRVHTPADLLIPVAKRRQFGAWAVALLKQTGHRRVRVPSFFPASVLVYLKKAGVRVEITEEPLYPERAVKRAAELECIRKVQRAAVAATRAAVEEIRLARVGPRGLLLRHGKKLTAEAVKVVIELELMKRQCQSRDTIVACGRQAADPHDRGTGPLSASQTIVLDIFPQHKIHGYWGDITRTVVKGTARPELHRLYQTVLQAQRHALSLIKPGVRADRVHEAVQADFQAVGYVTETRQGHPVGFFHGTGHGVGLDIHEDPRISSAPVRLRAGHVVTVEPGLYYPELGGVRIEDTVAVTREGFQMLCPCEKVFEL
jgi:Xaa-Pro aminopeptidase